MTPSVILALISDLYAQISTQAEYIKKLESALAEKETAETS